MKATLKLFSSFVLLTMILSIFATEPIMAQARSYPRSNQPSRSQSIESRARQQAEMRVQGEKNADRIKSEKARQAAAKAVQNNKNNSSNRGAVKSSSSNLRRCSDCRGTGIYECHRGYTSYYDDPKSHNCPQCGGYHVMAKAHSHKCVKCEGKGWK